MRGGPREYLSRLSNHEIHTICTVATDPVSVQLSVKTLVLPTLVPVALEDANVTELLF